MTAVCMPFVNAANEMTLSHHTAETNIDDMLNPNNQLKTAKALIDMVKKFQSLAKSSRTICLMTKSTNLQAIT